MGGLLVLALIAGYVWATAKLIKSVRPYWKKALVVTIAILIPTADALWGRYVTLPELCQDAGLRVFKNADKSGGLLVSNFSYSSDYWIQIAGIAFVEGVIPGKPNHQRITLTEGKNVIEENVIAKSKYRLTAWEKVTGQNEMYITGHELRIESRESSETLARFRTYAYAGGWVERLMGQFADSGPQASAKCPSSIAPAITEQEFILKNTFN